MTNPGNLGLFITRPISLVLLCAAFFSIAYGPIKEAIKRKKIHSV